MRTGYILYLLLLISVCFIGDKAEDASPRRQQRRNLNRRRKVPAKGATRRQPAAAPSPIPVPETNVPLYNGDDTIVHILQAVLGVSEQAPSYNIVPVKKGHCLVNGMVMYEKAVWSPKPCVTCMCSNGKELCDETVCPPLTCTRTVTHDGECCPVCSDIVFNSMPLDNWIEHSGDSPEPSKPTKVVLTKTLKTQEEMDELTRTEEEESNKKKERMKTKVQKPMKKKEGKKPQKAKKGQAMEDEERTEEERRRAYEEEELRIEEELKRKTEEEMRKIEEKAKKEEERKRKEEEDRLAEEVNRLVKERKQREREKLDLEDDEEEDDDEEDDNEEDEGDEADEDDFLRGDVFRVPRRRVPSSRRPTIVHHPPLPPGCFISEITVSCSNAKLTGIPPVSDFEMKSLDLLGNFITSIPKEAFNGMPNLEMIDLSKNKLLSTSIDPQAFMPLKNLKRLYLDGNLLVQIPAGLPSTLEELKMNDNKLEGLGKDSLKDLTNLVTLEVEGNQLSEANVSPLAFKPLQQASYLRLGRNKFRTIPEGLPASLEELYLENNEIEEISETSLNHTTNLNTIVLRNNKLEETRIAPLTWILHQNLESIDLSYNKFYQVPSYLPKSLLHLVLVGNQIERIPGYIFAHLNPGLEYLYLSFNKLDNDGLDPISFHGAYHSLREIFLDYNELTSVPIGMENMKDLHILRLNNNKIKTVSPNCVCNPEEDTDSSLEYLHLENNYISTREISPYAFVCIRSYSSVILKPQKVK
ncbi:extracellular matrix protein 2 isoform X2 [Hyperolius riggenbachi]|uniref:extracellular matrix protein 2 isoform X2 n=1 Tax=Hyperolius riggenbachi TaxID=752182 RepID=UPI0035A32B27